MLEWERWNAGDWGWRGSDAVKDNRAGRDRRTASASGGDPSVELPICQSERQTPIRSERGPLNGGHEAQKVEIIANA